MTLLPEDPDIFQTPMVANHISSCRDLMPSLALKGTTCKWRKDVYAVRTLTHIK